MAVEIPLPKMGHLEEEATLGRWLKQPGDRVEKGDILFEVETDKAVLEVDALSSGVILEILIEEGETVPVGTPVALMEPDGNPPELASDDP